MGLNIVDEETCRLASELAELTGEAVAEAVAVAVKERVERERAVAERFRKIMAISERSAALFRETGPLPDHGEFLYDERGLPK